MMQPGAWMAALALSAPAVGCDLTLYPVRFGDYSGTETRARGEVVLDHCATPQVTVSLNAGQHGGGHFTARYLQDAFGNRIAYNLYLDPGHGRVWGDGTQGSSRYRGVPGRFMIYARVPAYQFVPVGEYRDRVEVLVEW